MHADDLLSKHFTRLKVDQKAALNRIGIATIRDLLYHFPARYESAGPTGTIAGATPGTDVTLYGTVRSPETRKAWKSRKPMAEAWLEDSSGRIKMMWFSQPYMAKMVHDGMVVKATGKITGTAEKPYLANPEIDKSPVKLDDVHDTLFSEATGLDVSTMYPVYPESRGVSSLWFSHAVRKVFEAKGHESVPDPIPQDILERYSLPTLATALVWVHAPRKRADADAAKKRFAFEEVFTLQLALQKQRADTSLEKALPVTVDRESLQAFMDSFPFPPTDAQIKSIGQIVDDFEKPHPMRRLLEGDVGSGKTAVAAATAYLVATSRPPGRKAGTLQVAYMCPTEILAKQHFSTFVSYFKDHPIPIGLITGNECRKFPSKIRREESTKISRAQFTKWVANGEIPIVIGTHALIQKSVEFSTLAYSIIDEQHRFGKVHRANLAKKSGLSPHLLSMTATPIPRTLALTIYGDLDLSLLDQMPTGRKPILTEVLGPEKRDKAYDRVRQELSEGRQAYVICPRINEPDPTKELALIAKSVKSEAERLRKEVFPEYEIDILHSKMSPKEKEDAMDRFESGETNILVATSVVEVGVNVPNATVILIEGAERFGLSQLHQLRGRVIRSNHQAYCFVLPEKYGPATKDRLKALTTAKNGFELAEYDLALRGAGELAGNRQWGISDIAMEAIRNLKMVEAARTEAAKLIKKDAELKKFPLLQAAVKRSLERMHME
ncbi:ATP-dependent DNA helicase RecG [Patescibacteria group bacterium]|nr:ATP-dependent DNA helicase RecG [Patescibacteria group bacterium]MBU1754737.1 ATP-dependent DNA helicase RecG [Patescibacteria group bacterium]